MPQLVESPVRVPVPGGKLIDEYVGRASTSTEQVSVAHMRSPAGWEEPAQTPEFDEVTLVLGGAVHVEHDGGVARRRRRPGGAHPRRRAGPLHDARGRRVRRRLPAGVRPRHGATGRASDADPRGRPARARRSCSTTTSTAACDPRPSSSWRRQTGYAGLPTTDADELGRWFQENANAGSLPRYLSTFAHTVGVMQTRDALVRVARECAQDLADDGVVYAEVRFAPELHLEGGLSLTEVVEAVQEGYRQGCEGRPIRVVSLLTAMRHAARSLEIAELAVHFRDKGVVGFDIAGAEAGYPPSRHLAAFQHMQRENGHFTIHAGEAFGLPSIWEALQECHADRLGHGVRIVDDISVDTDGTATLGRLAQYVRDTRIPLEMCPSSNVQTGAAASIAEHPIGLLRRLQFRVTVNTDNRLMSGVSVSSEMAALVDAFGYGWDDLRWLTINAMKSAFIPFDQRLRIIDEVDQAGLRDALTA